MAYSEAYCDQYFLNFERLNPVYIWGMNIHRIQNGPAEIRAMYETYGSPSSQYNLDYYTRKINQALAGSGYGSDCSGFFRELSVADRTAAGYYASCVEKGSIDTIDLKHSCLVFRGSANKISHVGYFCASKCKVLEMANSDKNFQSQPFNAKYWTYWGKPDFIDYNVVETPVTPAMKPYLYKGVDMSTYQKNIDYKALKDAGVDFAILKIMNKNRNMDSEYLTHVSGCNAVGIEVKAVYNYSYAATSTQAMTDAQRVLELLGDRKCAVCLDVEDNVQKNLGASLVDIINVYQNVIENSGRSFILYTGLSFYNSFLKPYSSSLKCKNLWIARYNRGYIEMPFEEDPDMSYKPLGEILAWQYTSSGKIAGYNGRLDLNVMFKEIEPPSVSPISSPVIVPTPTPIPSVQLNPVIKNTVKTNGSRLNVRKKPTTNSDIVGKMTNGSNVIIYGVDKTGQWARLSVFDSLWTNMDYISSTGKGIVTAEKSLYIRSSDSKSGEVWGVYKANTVVEILHQSTNTGWYLTVGKDKDGKQIGGWCSNNYIRIK